MKRLISTLAMGALGRRASQTRIPIGLILALVSTSVHSLRAQCEYYEDRPPIVTYLGCETDSNGQPIGRRYRISVPLAEFHGCPWTWTFRASARNVDTDSSIPSIWTNHGNCEFTPPGDPPGYSTETFIIWDSLFGYNFRPGDHVQIDYWANSSRCRTNAYSFIYPAAVAPAITNPPQSQTVCDGSPVTFTVSASGGPLAYQWRKDQTNIAGQYGSTLTIPSAQPTNAGSYDVVVRNGCGATTSAPAALVVLPYAYARWMSTFTGTNLPPLHLRGPGDDPDGDGLVNAAEYAFNLAPMVHNSAARPRSSLVSILSSRYLAVTYRRHRWTCNVSLQFDSASRPVGPWLPATMAEYDSKALDGDTDEVTLITATPVNAEQSQFVRIRVELGQ